MPTIPNVRAVVEIETVCACRPPAATASAHKACANLNMLFPPTQSIVSGKTGRNDSEELLIQANTRSLVLRPRAPHTPFAERRPNLSHAEPDLRPLYRSHHVTVKPALSESIPRSSQVPARAAGAHIRNAVPLQPRELMRVPTEHRRHAVLLQEIMQRELTLEFQRNQPHRRPVKKHELERT